MKSIMITARFSSVPSGERPRTGPLIILIRTAWACVYVVGLSIVHDVPFHWEVGVVFDRSSSVNEGPGLGIIFVPGGSFDLRT